MAPLVKGICYLHFTSLTCAFANEISSLHYELESSSLGRIAFGLDRIAMILTGSVSIRGVIAFPKSQKAAYLMTEALSAVDTKQLKELKLKFDLSELLLQKTLLNSFACR